MKILSLDVATHMGWAYFDGTKIAGGGTWDFSVKRDESTSMKFIRLKSELNKIKEKGIDLLVFESARHSAPKMQGALVVQAELQAIVKNWSDENQIAYRGYSPSEPKKFATGLGNCSKDLMVSSAKQAFNMKIVDDNHADALWILALAMYTYEQIDVRREQTNKEEKVKAMKNSRNNKKGST